MPVFNRSKLLEVVGDDAAFLESLLENYLEDTEKKITRLRDALADGKTELVFHIAHSLKGASANMTAEYIREAAALMEEAAKKGDLIRSADCFRQVESEFERLKALCRQKDLK